VLAGGVITGLPMIPLMYAILQIPGDNLPIIIGLMMIILGSAGFLLGMAVARRVQGTWSPVSDDGKDADGRDLSDVQARQATRAGATAGAVAGLGITLAFSLVLGLMMILGPLVAAGGAAFGVMTVADRQRRGIPARSLMAGVFVSRS
jgi:small-conductance mechanosensitive channel